MHINKIIITCLVSGVISACCSPNVSSAQETSKRPVERGNNPLENDMRSMIAGNPVADAEQAIRAGDKRLWAYHNRNGQVIPDLESTSKVNSEVLAVKIAPGMGDVIYGKVHKELRQQMLNYMQQYNHRVLQSR